MAADNTADQAYEADQARVQRAFVGLGLSLLGFDQTNLNDDYYAGNRTGQYVIANPDGTYSAQGQPISNQQPLIGSSAGGGLSLSPMALLLIGVGFYLAFAK